MKFRKTPSYLRTYLKQSRNLVYEDTDFFKSNVIFMEKILNIYVKNELLIIILQKNLRDSR